MSTTDLAQQVADLTTATTQLTQEVVGQKARLTAAADTATGKASEASGSASAASASATAANAAAAEAETSKNQAAEIAGLDTVEEAIDLTLAKTLGLMTETEAMAQADAYEQVFAASGMVHMGKQFVGGAGEVINEGMWIYPDAAYPNTIWLGRENAEGTSETDYPVTYIAGAISNILGTGTSAYPSRNLFHLPPAEAGTRVYDSAGDVRGSGEATLDFRYDPDPKYGAAPTGTEAEILREAVGRAFEGQAKNGDFRLGETIWGTTYTGNALSIANSVATVTSGGSRYTGIQQLANWHETGIEYDFEITILSASTDGDLVMSFNNEASGNESFLASELPKTFRFTGILATASAGNLRFYVDSGGLTEETYSFSNFSWKPTAEEVVTHRSDVATWESYDEELTGRKEIMECIQSLSTTFGDTDVPTVLSTRPLSYFQQYDGQFADPDIQNDRYRCVVWDDLTDEQKRKVAAYMGNKLYVGENGNLVNRRLRARTFRGLGNGDWENIDVTHKGASWDQFLSFTTSHGGVRPQGSSDSSQAYSNTSGDTYATTPLQETNNDVAHKGAFAVWSLTNQAYKGRCFMYVVASVPRANQGFYHPNLNPWGTASVEESGYGFLNWSHSRLPSDFSTTLKDCFYKVEGVYTCPFGGDIAGGAGRNGHPDGIFYDGITAGGLNGVIDWRLPAEANDSPEEQAKVQGKVENKTFRGLEKLVWSQVSLQNLSNSTNSTVRIGKGKYEPLIGSTLYSVTQSGSIQSANITGYTEAASDYWDVQLDSPVYRELGGYVVYQAQTNLSVSGEFHASTIVGDPANLIQADDLKHGWLGYWCPVIPDGTTRLPAVRKRVDSGNIRYIHSSNLGGSWTVSDVAFDPVDNDKSGSVAGLIAVMEFTAESKVTKPSSNKAVYGGKKGVMGVLTSNSHEAESATFFESLLGKVPTHSGDVTYHEHLALRKVHFEDDGRLKNTDSGNRNILHEPTMLTHLIDTPALKVLPYQIAENGQCFIGYQANELTWEASPVMGTISSGNVDVDSVTGNIYRVIKGSGTVMDGGYWYCLIGSTQNWDSSNWSIDSDGDVVNVGSNTKYLTRINPQGWGDDDKIKVTADGSDNFIDRNGNTNLSVSHKTTMPTGWTKNRARIGEQVEGVDL